MKEKINPVLLDVPDELIGERITMRAYRDEDAPRLWDAVETARHHLQPWMPWVKDHVDLEFSRTYIRRMRGKWILREDLVMGIFLHGSGLMVGAIGLHRIDWSVPSLETGYWALPDAEGKGYISEAVALIRDFAFNHLHAERLTVMCDTKNRRSAAVPPRAGFRHEATLHAERRNGEGQLRDTELFAMSRADFDALPTTRAR